MKKLGRQLLTCLWEHRSLGMHNRASGYGTPIPEAGGSSHAGNGAELSEGKQQRSCNYPLHPNARGAELRLPGKLHR